MTIGTAAVTLVLSTAAVVQAIQIRVCFLEIIIVLIKEKDLLVHPRYI